VHAAEMIRRLLVDYGEVIDHSHWSQRRAC
jgi:hypothetical protein